MKLIKFCLFGFPQNKLCAQIHWLIGPSVDIENQIELQFYNEELTSTIEPSEKIKVSLFMPDMGHGSSPTSLTRKLDQNGIPEIGYFKVSKIHFMMDGDWELRISLKSSNGSQETGTLKLHL